MSRSSECKPPARRRVSHESRGSVLIFVVGVLLLMAIIATAFLGSSRSDRTSTQQNAFNTQVDLLIDGVVAAAKGRVSSDETVPGGSIVETWDAITYGNNVSGGPSTNDDWLASRVPTTADLNSSFSFMLPAKAALNEVSSPTDNPAWWPVISEPVLGETFASPYLDPNQAKVAGYLPTYTIRERVLPTYVQFGGQNWPALRLGLNGFKYLAGDADGDGVADSGLFKIPVGELAGLTYYGAVRIIDNNAAVNLNTALSRDYDFTGRGRGSLLADLPLAGAFTSNVGLAELLRSTIRSTSANTLPVAPVASQTVGNPYFDHMSTAAESTFLEFTPFNKYRWNITSTVTVRPSAVNEITTLASDNTGRLTPYDDTPTATDATKGYGLRGASAIAGPEYQYLTIGAMLNSQVGSRVANPGITRYTGTRKENADVVRGRPLFVDGLTLASRFAIATPGVYDFSATDTNYVTLSTALAPSLFYVPNGIGATLPGGQLRTSPYNGTSGAGIDKWFQSHFDYLAENNKEVGTFMNRRTILTTANGVTDRATASIAPPDYLFINNAPQWAGAVAPLTARRDLNAYEPYTPSGGGSAVPTVPMSVIPAPTVVAASTVASKISINSGAVRRAVLRLLQGHGPAGVRRLGRRPGHAVQHVL